MRRIMEKQKKMSNVSRKLKNVIFNLKILGILICTIIGGYGILHAPDSDQKEMEQELRKNEQLLQSMESAPCDTPCANTPIPTQVTGTELPATINIEESSISVIGDSVFLGAAPAFRNYYENAVIDAKISRQVCQALDVAKKLEKKKKLGNTVIIALGINGNFNPATGQALIDYLGTKRKIYWINANGEDRDIQKKVNKTIQELVKKNKNVYLIDWAAKAKKHPDWFYQDETHLNAKGQEGYARFVKKSLEEYNADRSNTSQLNYEMQQ